MPENGKVDEQVAVELVFKWERDTKNKHRYTEQAEFEDEAVIGTLYVSKRWLRQHGNPDGTKPLKMTLAVD